VAHTGLSNILEEKPSALPPFNSIDSNREQHGASTCGWLMGETEANFLNVPLFLKPESSP